MAAAPKRVWITRTQYGAERTAQKVRQKGQDPLVAPVLEIKRLYPDIRLNGDDPIVITSENALHILENPALDRARRIYSVGANTAQAVKALGYGDVVSANGTVRDLFELICQEAKHPARLVYLRGVEVSAPLKSWLAEVGVEVDEYSVYVAEKTIPRLGEDQWAQVATIMLHSARAAEIVAEIYTTQISLCAPTKIRVIAISPTVAQKFVKALQSWLDMGEAEVDQNFEICISESANDEGMLRFVL